jgi:hypothetical protein
MVRTRFANLLMRKSAETGISFYKIGKFGGIEGPTFTKWLKPVGHEQHRNPTERQVLEVAASLAYDGSPPVWLQNLYDDDDSAFLAGLERLRAAMALSWTEIAETSAIGHERLREIVAGTIPTSGAIRLRLIMATVFSAEQLELANALLQAADRYVLRAPSASRRSA